MKRVKLSEIDVPLSAFSVEKLRRESNVSGLLIPTRQSLPPLIVDGTGQVLTLITLEGDKPFRHFDLHMGSSVEGLLFSGVEIGVSIPSRVNPQSEVQLGDLTLAFGKANLLCASSRDTFGDAQPFPLQIAAQASGEVPMAFRQWSIFVKDGEREIELWRNTGFLPEEGEDD